MATKTRGVAAGGGNGLCIRGATPGRLACVEGMKTFLLGCGKVLLVLALAVAVVHFWPVTVVPFAVGFVLLLGLGAAMVVGLVAAGAVGLALVGGLLAVAVALLGVLSPVWIPLLVVVGIVWLVRRPGGSNGRPTAAA